MKFSFNKLLAFALISNPAMANWEYIATNDEGNEFYVSSDSIKRSGWNKRTAWELINFSPDSLKFYKSGIVQQEYDCNSNRVRTLYASGHSEFFGKGKTIQIAKNLPLPWQEIPDGSAATYTRDYICNKKDIK